jgi:rod shape-determining protein MreD
MLSPGARPWLDRRGSSATTLTLAAVGAVVAAVLELSLWPYLAIGEAHPHITFVYVVVLAVVLGLEASLAAAFVGGLAVDLLAPRPLGSTAFALLLAAGAAVLLARLLVQVKYVAPVLIVFVLSFGYSILVAALYRALGGGIDIADPLRALLPGAIYDAVLAAVVGPVAVALRVRRLDQERVDW